jgi:CheY-like chemotaxis protein
MRITIWILEDDDTVGYLLKTVLSLAHPNVHQRLFVSGEAALKATGFPDIVFADTYLSGKLTGPQVVDILRKRNRELSVMYSSSLGLPLGVKLGPRDRVLPKPFSVAALLDEVSEMISRVPRLQMPPPHPPPHSRRFKHR